MLVSCRCAQGPAPPGDQGRHHAPAWREPGGPADAPLLPERCHSSCEGEPDDSHQLGRVLGAFPLPPQHPQEREFLSKVRVRWDARVHGETRMRMLHSLDRRILPFLVGLSVCFCWIHTWIQQKGVWPPSFTAHVPPLCCFRCFHSSRPWGCDFLDNLVSTRSWERFALLLCRGRCFPCSSPQCSL